MGIPAPFALFWVVLFPVSYILSITSALVVAKGVHIQLITDVYYQMSSSTYAVLLMSKEMLVPNAITKTFSLIF